MNLFKITLNKMISREELSQIDQLINKIKKGNHKWSPEDAQLYQNNSQLIEERLKSLIKAKSNRIVKASKHWDNYTVDEISLLKDPNILREILEHDNSPSLQRQYAAWNPNCPTDVLRKIIGNLEEDNWIVRNAVENDSCPSDVLQMIVEREEAGYRKDDYYFRLALRHHNCPPEVLAKVVEESDYDKYNVLGLIAIANPVCPQETLKQTVLSYAPYFAESASRNPNCPTDILTTILEKGENDWLSKSIILNPKCPPGAKVKWMQATGKIIKEDPSKHVIEYDDKEEEDKDLNELRKMVGKGNNWYKTSQWKDEWKDIKNLNSPESLKELYEHLKRNGRNYLDERYMALVLSNPYCPPDVLMEQVQHNKNEDYLTKTAIQNPNCPPEALEIGLGIGITDDSVSVLAAHHPNCPRIPKLQFILTRFDKYLGRPDDGTKDWYMEYYNISSEDYSLLQQEFDTTRSLNNDININESIIRDILSKGNNWYKTSQEAIPKNIRSELVVTMGEYGYLDKVNPTDEQIIKMLNSVSDGKWVAITRDYRLSEDLTMYLLKKGYIKNLRELLAHQKVPDEWIKNNKHYFGKDHYSAIASSPYISENALRMCKDDFSNEDWTAILTRHHLSKEFIQEFESKFEMERLLEFQQVPEEMIEKAIADERILNHPLDANWAFISAFQPVSEEFIKKYHYAMDISTLMYHRNVWNTSAEEFIEQMPMEIDKEVIEAMVAHQNISPQFVIRHYDLIGYNESLALKFVSLIENNPNMSSENKKNMIKLMDEIDRIETEPSANEDEFTKFIS